MKNNQIIMVVVGLVVVGVIAFFAGMKYQQSQPRGMMGQFGQFRQGQGGQRGQGGPGGMGGRRGFGGANVGEVVSVDANSMTIKLPDGSSKIINISDKTTYSKTDTAVKSDLKTGERIAVFGTPNSDGSVEAQNIQLNPMFRNMMDKVTPQPTK